MNFPELKNTIKYIQEKCPCTHCKRRYQPKDIFILGTDDQEGFFELYCPKCQTSSLISVGFGNDLYFHKETPSTHERNPQAINQDDVLDIKNFLTKFDGNFKKIFHK